jgi:hypothetical protein
VVEAGNADEAVAILEGRPDFHIVFTRGRPSEGRIVRRQASRIAEVLRNMAGLAGDRQSTVRRRLAGPSSTGRASLYCADFL